MRMRSKTGKTIIISLMNGSAIAIGENFRDVPVQFRRDALGMPDKIEVEGVPTIELDVPEPELPKVGERLVPFIVKLADSGEQGAFTVNGMPNLNMLSRMAEYKVSRDEMVAAFELYKEIYGKE